MINAEQIQIFYKFVVYYIDSQWLQKGLPCT